MCLEVGQVHTERPWTLCWEVGCYSVVGPLLEMWSRRRSVIQPLGENPSVLMEEKPLHLQDKGRQQQSDISNVMLWMREQLRRHSDGWKAFYRSSS